MKPRIHTLDIFGRESIPPREMKRFRRWAKANGFRIRPTYNNESVKRAFSLVGTGKYEGFLFMCLNRQRWHHEHPECKDGRRGHRREDCDLMIETSIACFYRSRNLTGAIGVTWHDFPAGRALRLFRERKPVSVHTTWDREMALKQAA